MDHENIQYVLQCIKDQGDTAMEAYLSYDKLTKYLGSDLYCKEELQFALYLYNLFLRKKDLKDNNDEINIDKTNIDKINNVVKECLGIGDDKVKNIVIEDVFFEAALMRDYFAHNDKKKEEFNRKLLKFCLNGLISDAENSEKEEKLINERIDKIINELKIKNKKTKTDSSRNLGQTEAKKKINTLEEYSKYPDTLKTFLGWDIQNKTEEEKRQDIATNEKIRQYIENKEEIIQQAKEKTCLSIASMMMNATPDILVIYKYTNDPDNIYVKALECKYTSGENSYKDVAGVKYPMQIFIQECIMHFLFGKRKKLEGEDEKEETEKNYIKFPKNSIWKNKELLWEEICESVFKNILMQKSDNNEFINTGVEMIKFKRKEGKNNDSASIQINDEVNIQVIRINSL